MYLKFRKNFYSQNGEDGIVEKLISDLGLEKKLTLCEFGAWDGKYLSNTFNLIKKFQSTALLIEGDQYKFKDLLDTSRKYQNIIPVQKFVSCEGKNSLDQILSENSFPSDFDLLSIDIDSNDLEIWESLVNFKPKIVIIEINSSILPGIKQRHDPSKGKLSSSFTSTLEVAKKKGYFLVAHTGNLIFIKNQFKEKINFNLNLLENPEKLFIYDWVIEKTVFRSFFISIMKFVFSKSIRKKISLRIKQILKPTLNNHNKFK
jgi:hypothetical protein